MEQVKAIGLGGGCHWCTEAVFQSLHGVLNVKQGFVASEAPQDAFSEAVIITYEPGLIALYDLVLIHLMTHESTVWHDMRPKYRSASLYHGSGRRKSIGTNVGWSARHVQLAFGNGGLTLQGFSAFRNQVPKLLSYRSRKTFLQKVHRP